MTDIGEWGDGSIPSAFWLHLGPLCIFMTLKNKITKRVASHLRAIPFCVRHSCIYSTFTERQLLSGQVLDSGGEEVKMWPCPQGMDSPMQWFSIRLLLYAMGYLLPSYL